VHLICNHPIVGGVEFNHMAISSTFQNQVKSNAPIVCIKVFVMLENILQSFLCLVQLEKTSQRNSICSQPK
jgi:hypothetical protein